MGDIYSIAAELYALPLADFVSSRNQRAKTTEDSSLAAAVRRLKKPSAAAWAVNMLSRQRAELVAEIVTMGWTYREAQKASDGAALRSLDKDRRALLSRAATEATALAQGQHQRLGPSAMSGLDNTLRSAMADQDAGQAVKEGRLIAELDAPGIGPVDLTDKLAIVIGQSRRVNEKPPTSAASRERTEQRRRARVAQRQTAVDHAAADVAGAAGNVEELRAEMSTLEAAKHSIQKELDGLTKTAASLGRSIGEAQRRQTTAQDRLSKARKSLRELP